MAETLAVRTPDLDGEGVVRGTVDLEGGPAPIAIRRRDAGDRGAPRA